MKTLFFPSNFFRSALFLNEINASGEATFFLRRSTRCGEAAPHFFSMESRTYFAEKQFCGEAGEAMNNVNEIKGLIAEKHCGEGGHIYNMDLRSRPEGGRSLRSGGGLQRLQPCAGREDRP